MCMAVQCPYCNEDFDSEHEEGVHRAKQHITDEKISTTKRESKPFTSKVDVWRENNE